MRSLKFAYVIVLPLLILAIIIYVWAFSQHILQMKSGILSLQPAFTYFKINDLKRVTLTSDDHGKSNINETCNSSNCIVLSVVCCLDRFEETYTMIKSAIMLTKSNLIIEIFTEEETMPLFNALESKWPQHIRKRVKMKLNPAVYPVGVQDKTWRNLFRKCASIRLFLPSLLKYVDSVIYVDTDVLFLAPLDELWSHFKHMNASQMVALAPEHEDPATGWYNRFAKHPYYGKLGVNSGVMLMNLTRLRNFGWVDYMAPIEKEFHSKISWGDQDIINIVFHYHPDKLYLMGCEYNYRPDHCMYMNMCKSVIERGVYALHGNRKVFHNKKQPAFRVIYQAWKKEVMLRPQSRI
ncbi:Glucoside xylosyltransferase 2 [Armadillidium vulgare]|nr:Glucoside xylosyltransferase 2 [Armadillidium vulgare]